MYVYHLKMRVAIDHFTFLFFFITGMYFFIYFYMFSSVLLRRFFVCCEYKFECELHFHGLNKHVFSFATILFLLLLYIKSHCHSPSRNDKQVHKRILDKAKHGSHSTLFKYFFPLTSNRLFDNHDENRYDIKRKKICSYKTKIW